MQRCLTLTDLFHVIFKITSPFHSHTHTHIYIHISSQRNSFLPFFRPSLTSKILIPLSPYPFHPFVFILALFTDLVVVPLPLHFFFPHPSFIPPFRFQPLVIGPPSSLRKAAGWTTTHDFRLTDPGSPRFHYRARIISHQTTRCKIAGRRDSTPRLHVE